MRCKPMDARLIIAAILFSMLIFGCAPAQETTNAGAVQPAEVPSYSNNVTVNEEVVVPAHVPEPVVEVPEPVVPANPDGILTEHKDSDYFLRAHPGVGEVVSSSPRKVDVIFGYPLDKGTEVSVWDKDETTRYGDEETVLADVDLLVAIVYLNDLEPGIYKVKYKAVFAGKKDAYNGEGYFYFKLQ